MLLVSRKGHDLERMINSLQQKLQQPLPGREAQLQMAPGLRRHYKIAYIQHRRFIITTCYYMMVLLVRRSF